MSDALNQLLAELGITLQATHAINFSSPPVLRISESAALPTNESGVAWPVAGAPGAGAGAGAGAASGSQGSEGAGAQQTPVPSVHAASLAAGTAGAAKVLTEAEKKKGKLCLNMIVKNESKIIERLLGSVLSIVDTYCICDTGSTDNTAEVIRAFMAAAGKAGEVYVEPFQNFGYNRTHALERAAAWGEYALLLDADMKLVIEPTFDKGALKEKGYCIIQKNGAMEYYNTRIVKTGVGVKCVGPTHEYYDFPGGGGGHKLSTLWIEDIGDGGCKADKFERDIRLLKAALEKEPRNDRYHFYLAQSYNHVGKKAEAYEYYKKRVELGGWVEEVFYAAMEAGNMAKELGKIEEAVYWWMEAYNKHPKRSESLYELAKYYREVGKNRLSQIFCEAGSAIPYPKDDVLFIKKACYEHLFEYEHSINSYYTGRPIDHFKYLELIGSDYNKGNVLSNYKFYVKKLKDFKGSQEHDFGGKVEKTIMGRVDTFTSSSPCIIPYGSSGGYLLNVRYVNYTIRPDGGYDFKHSDGKITTLNKVHWLGADLSVQRELWLDQVQDESLRYQGVEDVKVFENKGGLLFLGTVENPAGGRVTVGHGVYDVGKDRLYSTPFESPNGRGCEKNWAYFHDAHGSLKVVYEWSPLTLGTVEDVGGRKTLKLTSKDTDVPAFFRDLRGSSHGMRVDGEIWFLTHLVHYTTPRHYYHCVVVLDGTTLKYKKHSALFKFHGDPIEYALGMVVDKPNGRMLFSFSRMDRTSAVLSVPLDVFEKEVF
jgi:glycosyltransferase involved in cell wall biosynthesis